MKHIKKFKIFESLSEESDEVKNVIRQLAEIVQSEIDGSAEHISEYWEPYELLALVHKTNNDEIKKVLETLAELVESEIDGNSEHISEFWEPEALLELIGEYDREEEERKSRVGLTDNGLVLLELGSANSSSPRSWSMEGHVESIITNSTDSNDEIAKHISGSTDMLHFGNGYGLYKNGFKYKSTRIPSEGRKTLGFLNRFQKLDTSKKREFFEFIKSEMLVIRKSYIYKVINKSELDSYIDKLKNKFIEIENK